MQEKARSSVHCQEAAQLVKKGIYGYKGPHKWTISREFVDALSRAQKLEEFLTHYKALLRKKPGDAEDALFEAARKYRSIYSLPAALLAGPRPAARHVGP
jgi:hypothetical protein